jgi:hypothetical protein
VCEVNFNKVTFMNEKVQNSCLKLKPTLQYTIILVKSEYQSNKEKALATQPIYNNISFQNHEWKLSQHHPVNLKGCWTAPSTHSLVFR